MRRKRGRCLTKRAIDAVRQNGKVPISSYPHLQHCGPCMDRVDRAMTEFEHVSRRSRYATAS